MKFTVSIATVLFYSIFAFLFAAICPALCLGFGPQNICAVACDQEPKCQSTSCCSESCARSCEETEPLAVCLGAYGTQNSLRTDCSCPAPAKSPATFESYRLLKDAAEVAHSSLFPNFHIADPARDFHPDSRPFSIHAEIISTTVLRI